MSGKRASSAHIDPSDPVYKMLKRLEKKEGKDFSDKHYTLKNIRNSSRE